MMDVMSKDDILLRILALVPVEMLAVVAVSCSALARGCSDR